MKNISRTVILGVIVSVIGFGKSLGVDWDEALVIQSLNDFLDLGLRVMDLVVGPAIIWLRRLTDSPLIGLIKKAS